MMRAYCRYHWIPTLAAINFRSDNESPAAPEMIEALVRANESYEFAYGDDGYSAALTKKFSDLFETDLVVFPLATGTAANSIALAQMCPPYGSIYCHAHSHINTDECGAPEFYSAGGKLVAMQGEHGKLDAADLSNLLSKTGELGDHEVLPSAVSISQATESGTVYTPAEVASLKTAALTRELPLHMDGARFANAVQTLGCSPSEITWKSGVDVLSFGATKNGGVMAEAIIVFNQDYAIQLGRRRKRAGHLLSKMRFVSAQLARYIEDGLWLDLAKKANDAAQRVSDGIKNLDGLTLEHPVQANEVFVRIPDAIADGLYKAGFEFHRWPGTTDLYRLVMSHCTTTDEVDAFLQKAGDLCE
jgi:threonine aldolase